METKRSFERIVTTALLTAKGMDIRWRYHNRILESAWSVDDQMFKPCIGLLTNQNPGELLGLCCIMPLKGSSDFGIGSGLGATSLKLLWCSSWMRETGLPSWEPVAIKIHT